jgi:hypothetical protein
MALERAVHAHAQAVGRHVVFGDVDGDAPRVVGRQRRAQRLADALVVVHHLGVGAKRAHVFGVVIADDGGVTAVAVQHKGRMPGHVAAEDQLQGRIGLQGGLAHKGEPQVHVELIQNGRGLRNFFVN